MDLTPVRDGWLQPGNLKLGKRVFKFALPTGRPTDGGTCPGATNWCAGTPGNPKWDGKCYASERRPQGWNKRPVVKEARQRNLRDLLAPGGYDRFVTELVEEVNRKRVEAIRVHDSGDYFAPAYVDAWARVVDATPDVMYYAYTHSWRVDVLREPLERLRALPNMQLFASVDPSVEDTPPEGWRVARIRQPNEPSTKGESIVCPLSLVSINRRKGEVPGALVDGHRLPKSCAECRYCIKPGGHVLFNPH